jgi:hypothetical protein
MSNPSGAAQGNEPAVGSAEQSVDDTSASGSGAEQSPDDTQDLPTQAAPVAEDASDEESPAERRYTAPSGMDSSKTTMIERPADPATEIIGTPTEPMSPGKPIAPQLIPPRGEMPKPPGRRHSWGWVVALILVIAALVAVAILGTLVLTRGSDSKASQEDKVRSTIQNFDGAVQRGDLATLRSITCGATRDSYVNYDDRAWADTHARVAAALQYPVVASIDQVVVNGDHAEANVTTFMAYAPQTRSTRSFDLQFRDEQWKICQAPGA